MYRYPPSPLSDEELEELIPGFRRRKAIIDRRRLDLASVTGFLMIRPTQGGQIPESLKGIGFEIIDIEDTLVTCFWCRADGWLGTGQIRTPSNRCICLCCQATMMAMGILPADERNRTYLLADPDVPRRNPAQ